MKKVVLLILVSAFLLTGCMNLNNKPINVVEDLLYKYQTLDDDVTRELNESLANTDYTDNQKEEYLKIMKKQYGSLTYQIKDDIIDGGKATVICEITVLDYYKALKDANDYYVNHLDEFRDDNYTKFLSYKLEKLSSVKDKIVYTINFSLTMNDNKWQLDKLSNEVLDKISGVYAY